MKPTAWSIGAPRGGSTRLGTSLPQPAKASTAMPTMAIRARWWENSRVRVNTGMISLTVPSAGSSSAHSVG
jgi:hypothetical protein